MKTNIVMKRDLLGSEIEQRTHDGYFLLTSIAKAGDDYRRANGMPVFNVHAYLATTTCSEFVAELDKKTGFPSVLKGVRGRNSKTWVHPYVMLEIVMAMAPRLKVEVYGWIYDELIKYRDESRESYKKMCGALYQRHPNARTFPDLIADSALKIKAACKVDDWNSATEQQLKLRDKIHETVSIVADFVPNMQKAVDLGIARSIT